MHNRVYLGQIRHGDQYYPGNHEAIIDQTLWDQVQQRLVTRRNNRGGSRKGRYPFLLKGLVVDRGGRALSPTYSSKANGKVYRYYVSQWIIKEDASATDLPRLPAAALEGMVIDQMRTLLVSPELVSKILEHALEHDPTLDEAQVTVVLRQLDQIWEELFPAEQTRLVQLLVEKVIVEPDNIEVLFRPYGITSVAAEIQGETVA